MGLQEDWDSASPDLSAEWDAATPDSQGGEAPQAQAAPPEPSMGEVALNAAGKSVGNTLQNAYEAAANTFLGQVITHGLSALSDNKSMTGRPDFQAMTRKAGLTNPSREPQTPLQRIIDSSIQTAAAAASIPGPNLVQTVKSAVVGALSGGTGKMVEEATRDMLGETASHWLGVATGAIVPLVPVAKPTYQATTKPPQSPLNTKTRLETLKAAQKEGFVVEPESVVPSVANKLRSSVAGGGKLKIAASMENQKAVTEAAKKELGLPPQAELTPDTFKALKAEAGKPYNELRQLTGGTDLLEQVQQKRSDAAALWRTYFNAEKPPPDLRKEAQAADAAVHQLEDAIDNLAKQSKIPGLLNRIRGARMAFGKIYDVEAATNPGDGHVSLPYLGAAYREGKPLSGRLEVAGKFWNAFKPVAREGSSLGTTASGTDAASAAMLGTVANAGGSLLGTLAGTIPFARDWARNKSLSPAVQKSLVDTDLQRLSVRPEVARGLSRAALISKTLYDNAEASE